MSHADASNTVPHGSSNPGAGPLLVASGISKSFPGVQALSGVDFDLLPGEVHVLLGENGAGKSTLVKVFTGIITPDAGELSILGEPVRLKSPVHALELGLAAIHQELSLVPHLDVATNIFLGRTPTRGPLKLVDWKATRDRAAQLLDSLEAGVDPRALVNDLGVGKRQLVEIAKALAARARIVFMDEPTAALTGDERDHLFKIIAELKAKGYGIVYISHKLEEVHAIGDRVTVLRDGAKVDTVAARNVSVNRLIALMVGRELSGKHQRAACPKGEVVLEARGLGRSGALEGIDLQVRRGEILGIAGLVGSGRTELAHCLFGIDPIDAGQLFVDGRPVHLHSPQDAITAGIALLTENRKRQGLFTAMSVADNITLPALNARATRGRYLRLGVLDRPAQRRAAQEYVERLRIKTPSLDQVIANLSGGNQQKAILAKWLALDPKVVIFDEPTRGIDIGAKAEIYRLMEALTAEGLAIVMISSELPEILALSDRVLVMSGGRITGAFEAGEASQEAIMARAVARA